jgi:hypothetical protein
MNTCAVLTNTHLRRLENVELVQGTHDLWRPPVSSESNDEHRSIFLVCSALVFANLAFSAAPSFAQKKTIKARQEECRANKAVN